ncbi:MAG TPA: hypothetical protein PLV06_13010 [Bacteroidales bacterium]|nr:hypothetical protein [Bacteroidales bacterium]HPF04121.1 hypothetical protein [Bacteroidales bacterium]HPJ60071.1 hypothetical protein [Bacteroidales bacterium]HPR13301.1 hypothetical protein [Bacteroidales bacterium]HRW85542.1 hypothetical protein [Bacteroidales bacterium]
MKTLSLTFLIFLLLTFRGFTQELTWNSRFFSFFDNVEFGGSSVKIPQTMAGVRFSPELGIVWDSVHRFSAGMSMIHEFGSPAFSDYLYPSAWYEYNREPVKFAMGAFPRAFALEKYPRMFFSDSVSYYRPNINGMFFQWGAERDYLNIWLDWTGRQSESVRETFMAGVSGRYTAGIFYMSHFSYMLHFASFKDPIVEEALHDNLLLLTSAGADLGGRTIFDRLEGSAGWVLALERARADNTGWIVMHGLQVDVCAEYRFAGIMNSFYTGKGTMYFYNDHGNELYPGDPVYRAKVSNRTDLYVRFFRKQDIKLELTWSVFLLERRLYNEQMLKLWIDIGGRRMIQRHDP